MKWKLRLNSLFVKILCVVVVGVICVSISVGYITINISRGIFTDNYKDSQKKIFDQVNDDIYDFHSEIVKVIDSVNSHRAFRSYFTEKDLPVKDLSKNIYELKKQMKSSMDSNNYDMSVLVVGLNGRSYLNSSELLTMGVEEILNLDITKNALKNNKTITYKYLEKGITSSTKNEPIIIISKALNLKDEKPYGVINFIIKEKTFQKFYDYFTLEINDIVLLDENNIVLSSNKKENIGQAQLDFEDTINELIDNKQLNKSYESNRNTIFVQRLPYCNLTLCGTVDNNKALAKMYDVKNIAIICTVITLCVLAGIFLIVRQMTKPLYLLTEKMSKVRDGNFNEYIEVSGPEEIKELSSTYNFMITDINKHINELMKVQKEKRKAEIHALQMQINPHYIFNTLSSIKLLIWQGSKDKSITAIDAFINMIRNTISKTDEFITIKEEIENLKNYVLINNIRYGDRIKVEYFIMPDCYEYLIPKLILQPFIENSFFHAFPSEEEGEIQVFIKEYDESNIKIEVYDNGIGIDDDKIDKIMKGNEDKNRYFSGIGINNVDSRIKLIYGNGYGINIKSKINKGTTITIVIPKFKE
ncbi:sensor histidine kinase [Clostridium nigeriense]|uniref:sensor histidine kinase n=1 Tax=Clostridium nigeriense TaxID=1805470 RepID=UPI000830F4FF|nr:sensor histidine kinase [Clostridium nigeriense]